MSLRHPAVGMLKIYDEENDTELLNTLRIYLRNFCNQSDAAKELHVHLNTLKYRLKKIAELTGVDLRDYDDVMYLQISLVF